MFSYLLIVCTFSVSLGAMEHQITISDQHQKTISVLYYPGAPAHERVKLEVGQLVWTLSDRAAGVCRLENVSAQAENSANPFYQFSISVTEQQYTQLHTKLLRSSQVLYTSNASYNVGNELADIGYVIKPELLRMSSLSLATHLLAEYVRGQQARDGQQIRVIDVARQGSPFWGFVGLGKEVLVAAAVVYAIWYVSMMFVYAQ
jgi:hypothetical protein